MKQKDKQQFEPAEMQDHSDAALKAWARCRRRGIVSGAENAFEDEVAACITAYEGDFKKQSAVLNNLKETLLKTAEDGETRDMLDESLSEALLTVESSLVELSAEKELAEARDNGNKRIASLMQDAPYGGNPHEFFKTHRAAFMEIMSDLYSKKEADKDIGRLMTELTLTKLTELAASGEFTALKEIGQEGLKRAYIKAGDYARSLCVAERGQAANKKAELMAEFTERLRHDPHASYSILKKLEKSKLPEKAAAFVRANLKEAIRGLGGGYPEEALIAHEYSQLLAAGDLSGLRLKVQQDLTEGRVSTRFARLWQNRLAAMDKTQEMKQFVSGSFGRALQAAVISAVRKAELSPENAADSAFEVEFSGDGKSFKAVAVFNDHSARTEDGRLMPIPAAFWGNMLGAVDACRGKDYMQLCIAAFADEKDKKALVGEYAIRLADLALLADITPDNPRMLYLSGYFEDALREYDSAVSADERIAAWQNAEQKAFEKYTQRFSAADAGILPTEHSEKAGGREFERLNEYSRLTQGLELSCNSLKAAQGGAFYRAAVSYLVPPDFIAALGYLNASRLKASMDGISKELVNIPPAEAEDYAGYLGSEEDDAFYAAFTVRRLIDEGRNAGDLPEKATTEDFKYAAGEIARRFYGLDAASARQYADEVLDYVDKHRLLEAAELSPEQAIAAAKEFKNYELPD